MVKYAIRDDIFTTNIGPGNLLPVSPCILYLLLILIVVGQIKWLLWSISVSWSSDLNWFPEVLWLYHPILFISDTMSIPRLKSTCLWCLSTEYQHTVSTQPVIPSRIPRMLNKAALYKLPTIKHVAILSQHAMPSAQNGGEDEGAD